MQRERGDWEAQILSQTWSASTVAEMWATEAAGGSLRGPWQCADGWGSRFSPGLQGCVRVPHRRLLPSAPSLLSEEGAAGTLTQLVRDSVGCGSP